MRRAGNTYLFCHRTFPPGGGRQPGHAARFDGYLRDRKDRECAVGMTGETLACPGPRGWPPRGVGSHGGQPSKLAERAVQCGDPNAEILWPPMPEPTIRSTPAGPFYLSQPQRRTARCEREGEYIQLPRDPCTFSAANDTGVPGDGSWS